MKSLTFIDLFAGIGGFRKGMEQAGHKCVGFCEFDRFAVASYTSMYLITEEQRTYLATLPLKQRQKEILNERYRNGEWYSNDVRHVNAGNIPKCDCWCAGFPCQDISIAGKQLGFDGDRSSLFFELIRILQEQKEEDRPRFILLENVKNILSIKGGWVFARILIALDECGYDVQWQVFNTKDFGIPQNRERCYFVANLRAKGPAEVFPIEGAGREDSLEINQIGQREDTDRENPQRNRVYDADGLSPSLNGIGKGGNLEPQIPVKVDLIAHKDGYRRNTQVFSPDGITEALDTAQGGGRGHHVAVTIEVVGNLDDNRAGQMDVMGVNGISHCLDTMHEPKKVAVPITELMFIDKNQGGAVREVANTLTAREDRGVSNLKQTGTAVMIPLKL